MADIVTFKATSFVKIFEKISARVEPHVDPQVGRYLVLLVKNEDELRRFKADPTAALTAQRLNPRLVNAKVLGELADSIAERLSTLPGGTKLDEIVSKESSSSQERNFDHSSSWLTDKDGWNVMHDAGHSSEQTTGEMVGQKRTSAASG